MTLAPDATTRLLDDRTLELVEEVRELGRRYIRPLGLEADRVGEPPPPDHEFYRICARQGGLTGDAGDTGELSREQRLFRTLATMEEAAYWDRGIALSLPGPGLGGPALQLMGTDEQKERFLGIFRDRSRPRWAAMAMTEPDAGSDVARIKTRCEKIGDTWRLTGQKMFCSNAKRASWIVVWATLDPELGRGGHRAFVVEHGTPGLEILRLEDKLGSRGYETCSFALDDVTLPADHLIGTESYYQGRAGFRGAMGTFNTNRPIHAMQGIGIARSAFDEARTIVAEEYPRGRRRDEALEALVDIRRGIEAGRMLCFRAVSLAAHGRDNVREASAAKAYAPPMAYHAVSRALDIAGEAGIEREASLLEKLYRDVKILDIGEGTQQVQRMMIARRLVDLPRDT